MISRSVWAQVRSARLGTGGLGRLWCRRRGFQAPVEVIPPVRSELMMLEKIL